MVACIYTMFAIAVHAQVPGRVAYWKAENNAIDSQGGNNGTLPPGFTFVPDRFGTGFAFRIEGTPGTVPAIPVDGGSGALNLRRFTISAWVMPDAVTGTGGIILMKRAPGAINYFLYLNESNTVGLDFYVGDVNSGTHYKKEGTRSC